MMTKAYIQQVTRYMNAFPHIQMDVEYSDEDNLCRAVLFTYNSYCYRFWCSADIDHFLFGLACGARVPKFNLDLTDI
jgi:hypothetical protein